MARFGEINAQYFDDAGDPLSSGKIYFYETGTTTLKDTFSDINQTIANTNPVILSAAGRQPNIFFSGTAKAILVDKNDVQILVRDPVGQTASVFGDGWVATKIYSADAVVLGSDGQYYRSLAAGNQNNDPTSTSGYWTLLYSVEWNSGITYQEGAVVTYNGEQYQSLQNSNLNNNPSSATSYWVLLSFAWVSTTTYADNQNAVGTDGVLYTSQQAGNQGNDPTDAANRPTYWVGTSADAASSAAAAATSATAAATSATNAATSETNAANSATAAATSATNSANSATAAATSETNAANSATAAATSATNAATSETNAATSATNAANSATAAASSATAAATSETNAANSETAAATSATNAATSETNAATSETNAANSATAASTSATNAATSESNASTSATAAATSATNAATSATASASSATDAATAEAGAEAALADFDSKYLGAYATQPTGTAAGQLYFNTTSDTMFVYTGAAWTEAGSAVNGTSERQEYTATSGQTSFNATYDVGFVDVYLNGSKLIPTTDFTATNGTTVVLTTGATTGDNVSIVAYGAFSLADVYTKLQSDARYLQITSNLSDLDNAATAITNLGITATSAELNILDGATVTTPELNILDGATVSATELNLLDGLSRGSLIYGNSSGVSDILSAGTADQVLTSDGTDIAWADAGGPAGMTLLNTYTLSAVTLVEINDFSSTYDDYILIGSDFHSSSSNDAILMQFYISGTRQTADYAYNVLGTSTTSWNGISSSSNSRLFVTTGNLNNSLAGAGKIACSFTLDLFGVNTTKHQGYKAQFGVGDASGVIGMSTGGYYGGTGPLTQIRLYSSAGANLSGTVRIYGLTKV